MARNGGVRKLNGLEASEYVPELAIRGLVMARGGYTPDQIRKMDEEEILLIHMYQQKDRDETLNSVGKLLGVVWDLNEVEANKDRESGDYETDKIRIPLSLVINPKIKEIIESQKPTKSDSSSHFINQGSYVPDKDEKVVSMAELSKEEFYKMIGKKMPSEIKGKKE